ncbi:MAG: hypothetical protein ACR2RF_09100 [Geminicoccaceae bacterium]
MSWLALGLASMVFVGFVGLWSTALIFEDDAFSTPMSVSDSETLPLPPLDDTIDVRDAHLDDAIVPELRPEAPFDTNRNIAASSLQKQI